jgi:endonuclease-3
MDRKKQVKEILKRLLREYPAPKCALNFKTPFELLVATVLSAQTTDAQVNMVTKRLFRKYRSIKSYAEAPLEELREDMSSVNFYRNKGSNIKRSAGMVIEKYSSRVPRTMGDLITLPGVARKTANIILSDAYGIIEGIAVDTHVLRLSGRLGLSTNSDPVKVEQDLMDITPRKNWTVLSHLLILHGRNVCKARNPRHLQCSIYDICPSAGK